MNISSKKTPLANLRQLRDPTPLNLFERKFYFGDALQNFKHP